MQVGSNLADTIRYGLNWAQERSKRASQMKGVKRWRTPSYTLSVPSKKLTSTHPAYKNPDTLKKKFENLRRRLATHELQASPEDIKNLDISQYLSWQPATYNQEIGERNPDITEFIHNVNRRFDIDAERSKQEKIAERLSEIPKLSTDELYRRKRKEQIAKLNADRISQMRSKTDPVQNLALPGDNYLSPADENLIIYAAELASLAYDPLADITQRIPSIEDVVPITDLTREPMAIQDGFVAYDAQRRLFDIVFKGTNNMQDVLTDVNTFKITNLSAYNGLDLMVPISGHGGFIQRFINLSGEVMRALDAMYVLADETDKIHPEILITGHSLGGALATVAAFVIGQVIPSAQIHLITFESPRVFTKDTLDKFLSNARTKQIEESAIRISARNDIVPNVPPYDLGFRHVGRNYYIEKPYGATIIGALTGDQGMYHSMSNVSRALQEYAGLANKAEKNKYLPLTQGRGKIKRSSAKMKAKMAYVRSFKKH